MKITVDSDDREFLSRLHALGPMTIQGLCAEYGVTATAVRQRLTRLQEQGLISRDAVRHGRGRPHHTYTVTSSGQRQLGENYQDLAMILWRQLQRIDEPNVRRQVWDGIRDALVSRYGDRIAGESVSERMRGLNRSLSEHGFDVDLDESGPLPILRENHCPYLELAEEDAGICDLEIAVFERVLGSGMKLSQCCLDGQGCCEFTPIEAAGAEETSSALSSSVGDN